MIAHQRVGGSSRLIVASLFLVLVLGALRLPAPFTGDQALFTTAGEAITAGAKLYRDIWDIKQPGIFFFYQAAGRLFGFTEVGVHLFELFYQLAFALVLVRTLSRYFESRAALALVPLLTVGFYYAISDDWSLTQLEALAGFPLYVCLWSALRASERGQQASAFQHKVDVLILVSCPAQPLKKPNQADLVLRRMYLKHVPLETRQARPEPVEELVRQRQHASRTQG